MSFRSTAVQEVLDRGQFCAVAAMTPRGPHCTPLVFANSGARLWLTTSRRSVKARAWRTDPSVAGLVRSDDLAVTFTGTVHRVTVDVSGDLIADDDQLEAHHEAHAAAIMARV